MHLLAASLHICVPMYAMGRMMAVDGKILEEAAAWQVALAGDTPDFDAFIAWLEASEQHRLAYDQVVLLDAAIDEHGDQLRLRTAANDDGEQNRPSLLWWKPTAALAATAILAVMAWPLLQSGDMITERTATGEMRTIALGDEAQVRLDASTTLSHDKDDPRTAELLSGRAYFDVRHDDSKPFTVAVGQYKVRDLGTRFEIARNGDNVTVRVAEGSISIGGNGLPFVQAGAGDRIDIVGGKASKAQVNPATIGSWTEGRLVYSDAPLEQVVADINRYSKKKLALDPALAKQRFSGVLIIGDGSQLARNIADLMGLPLSTTSDTDYLGHRP